MKPSRIASAQKPTSIAPASERPWPVSAFVLLIAGRAPFSPKTGPQGPGLGDVADQGRCRVRVHVVHLARARRRVDARAFSIAMREPVPSGCEIATL